MNATIDKATRDHVWSILPTEYKDAVKQFYKNMLPLAGAFNTVIHYEYLFGYENLTSEDEPEEKLSKPDNQ